METKTGKSSVSCSFSAALTWQDRIRVIVLYFPWGHNADTTARDTRHIWDRITVKEYERENVADIQNNRKSSTVCVYGVITTSPANALHHLKMFLIILLIIFSKCFKPDANHRFLSYWIIYYRIHHYIFYTTYEMHCNLCVWMTKQRESIIIGSLYALCK